MSETVEVNDHLLGMDFQAFAAWSRGLVGHSERFHRALYRQLLSTGRLDPTVLPVWQEAEASRPGTMATVMEAAAADQVPEVIQVVSADELGQGATSKLLLRLADGREVEAVHIPMRAGAHHTVCVSSQVGCRMGCRFCRTASMGLVRNLAAHEIVGQVVAAARHTGVVPRNVVFMGMGEPLDNLGEVAAAVQVLTDINGLGLAYEHITVSTVGRTDGIACLAKLGLGRINLAVSLNAANDQLRSRLMPVNRVDGLERLKTALARLELPKGRRILISFVLIAEVNDGPDEAQRLADWCTGLPVMVNLIPFNPIPGASFKRPEPGVVAAFRDQLDRAGVPVRMRMAKGDDMLAACGQLATASV